MISKKIGLSKKIKLDLFSKVYDRKISEHVLTTLFWECTLRCNASCRHCGSDCKVSSTVKDMPAADFVGVIDSLRPHVDSHKTFVIFTGGEPLVRRDLETVGRELYNREFPWGIVTNGLLLDENRFSSLRAAGMRTATVSLDGFKEEHCWMRGNPLIFDRAVGAIKIMASDPGFIFDVVTCVNQRNFRSLERFSEFLVELGVSHWRIFTVFPVGRAKDDPELQLSGEQFSELMDFIVRTRKEGKINVEYACEGFLGGYEGEVRDNFHYCQAGVSVASVLADGSISACPSIRTDFYQGNIYRDDLWTVWNEKFKPFRDRSWARKDECASCDMFKYCRGGGMHLRDDTGKLILCHYHWLAK